MFGEISSPVQNFFSLLLGIFFFIFLYQFFSKGFKKFLISMFLLLTGFISTIFLITEFQQVNIYLLFSLMLALFGFIYGYVNKNHFTKQIFTTDNSFLGRWYQKNGILKIFLTIILFTLPFYLFYLGNLEKMIKPLFYPFIILVLVIIFAISYSNIIEKRESSYERKIIDNYLYDQDDDDQDDDDQDDDDQDGQDDDDDDDQEEDEDDDDDDQEDDNDDDDDDQEEDDEEKSKNNNYCLDCGCKLFTSDDKSANVCYICRHEKEKERDRRIQREVDRYARRSDYHFENNNQRNSFNNHKPKKPFNPMDFL